MFVAGNGRGGRFKTKKDLKAQVAAGTSIDLIGTGMGEDCYTSESMPAGKLFTIVGPTEYQRNWYANAKKNASGKLVIS